MVEDQPVQAYFIIVIAPDQHVTSFRVDVGEAVLTGLTDHLLRLIYSTTSGARYDKEMCIRDSSSAFYSNGEPLILTPREQSMLQALIAKPGHVVTKERLFRIVFADEEQVHVEAIEVVAHRLRKKLVGTGAELMTLRGLGYLLRDASPVASRGGGA